MFGKCALIKSVTENSLSSDAQYLWVFVPKVSVPAAVYMRISIMQQRTP